MPDDDRDEYRQEEQTKEAADGHDAIFVVPKALDSYHKKQQSRQEI